MSKPTQRPPSCACVVPPASSGLRDDEWDLRERLYNECRNLTYGPVGRD